MPNWCVNQVDIFGESSEIAKLVAFVKSEEESFDFAKIVPPPASDIYSASDTQNDFQCGCKMEFITTKLAEGEPFTEGFVPQEGYWAVNGVAVEKQVLGNGTIKDEAGAAFGGVSVCPEHKVPQISSHPDWWYNWNVNNWGTKWGASDVQMTDDYEEGDRCVWYSFDTAWSPAEPVIQALSEKFPTLHIEHRYCEGGMSFAGEVIYEGGVELARNEYSGDNDNLPDEAYFSEDGERGYERDYDRVPMTAYERFCDEHFGGVVGG